MLTADPPAPRRAAVLGALALCALFIALAPTAPAARAQARVNTYGYEVLEQVPQPRENFVQGLQIVDDRLYVGTGLYGQSYLRIYEFPAMELLQEVRLAPELFGEGITRLGERIYQLTWRAGRIFVYAAGDLALVDEGSIATEGWGITHDGDRLIYSDGSDILRFLAPDTLAVEREVAVTLYGRAVRRLNELEYIDGEVWANVWGADQLVRIDPSSGRVTGVVDLRGLLGPAERTPDTDVLNGIAWDADSRSLWVTGKRWPWLFRLRTFALPATR